MNHGQIVSKIALDLSSCVKNNTFANESLGGPYIKTESELFKIEHAFDNIRSCKYRIISGTATSKAEDDIQCAFDSAEATQPSLLDNEDYDSDSISCSSNEDCEDDISHSNASISYTADDLVHGEISQNVLSMVPLILKASKASMTESSAVSAPTKL